MSHNRYNILSTPIPFVPWSVLPFLRYSYFKIWPWKSKIEVIDEGHIVGITPYWLVRCRWALHIQLFKNLTLKIQGRGHGWGEHWKSQHGSNILSTHPFCSMSIGHPIPEIWLFQNLTLKIQGQGHGWGGCWKSQYGSNTLSTRIPFVPCQSAIPFLRYDFFKIWPWKSKVKVMAKVKVESHKVGVTFYWLTSLSFHVNRPFHSCDTKFSKSYLENPLCDLQLWCHPWPWPMLFKAKFWNSHISGSLEIIKTVILNRPKMSNMCKKGN